VSVSLLRADARCLPLPDDSVDLVCTSPPYWGLRDYRDGDASLRGQLGTEPEWREFLDNLVECTREWVRVLRPDGSLWVNLGDKYAGGNNGPHGGDVATSDLGRSMDNGKGLYTSYPAARWGGVPEKSLIGLPWRYALRCMDDLGLILRAEVVWNKLNGLPESVRDRVRRNHEQWFHFTLRPDYYSAIDAVREPHTMRPQRRSSGRPIDTTPRQGQPRQAQLTGVRDEPGVDGHPLGALPRSVWSLPTQPLDVPAELGVDHFAAFPMEMPRRIVRGWSPRERCTCCGRGRTPVIDRPGLLGGDNNPTSRDGTRAFSTLDGGQSSWERRQARPDVLIGWECGCPDTSAPSTPGVVLDPFGGTGTTALIADVEGRVGLSSDLSADYLRLARWRTTDPRQRAAAMEVEYKPPRGDPSPEQMGLFE
jgi:SAM-dependent methyltransferase